MRAATRKLSEDPDALPLTAAELGQQDFELAVGSEAPPRPILGI